MGYLFIFWNVLGSILLVDKFRKLSYHILPIFVSCPSSIKHTFYYSNKLTAFRLSS